MIDNTDLNELLMKAINRKPKVLNIEAERIAFEKSWVAMGGSMKYFTWVASDWKYIILDENAYLYRLSLNHIDKLMQMVSASWASWLSRAEIALETEANILAGLSENTLVPNKRITFFFQDDDEPENAVDSINETIDQQSKNILGENYEFKDIVLINRIKQAYLGTDKIYATWDSPKKEKFIFASHEECLNIINGKEV